MLNRDPLHEENRLTVSARGPYDARLQARDPGASADESTPPGEPAMLLRLFKKRKGTIALIGFLGALAGLLIQLPKAPVYRATVSIAVEPQNDDFFYSKDVSPSSTLGGSYPDIELATQVKVLKSRALQNRVVEKLASDQSLAISAPEDRLSAWKKALHLPAPPPDSREGMLQQAAGSLQVKSVSSTRAIDISCDSPDPKLASAVANATANEYIEQSLESRWTSARRTSEWLGAQLNDMKVKLQKSEEDLQSYAAAMNLVPTGDSGKGNMANDKLRQLQNQLLDAQADLAAKQARYELAITTAPDSLAQVLDDATLRSVDLKLADLRRELAQLSSTLTPAHYKVQEVQSQINEMEAARRNARDLIVERIHNDFEEGKRREQLLSSALTNQSAVVTDQSGKIIHYDILQHEADSNRQLYESLLQRVKEAGLSSALRASNIQIIDAAETPSAPVGPNVPFGAAVGLFAGLLSGISLVVVQDRMNPCIEGPGDAAFYLGLPELGSILSWSLDGKRGRPSRLANFGRGSSPAKGRNPKAYSSVAESFRLLLTSILFIGQRRRIQVLVVTSPGVAEGKSTIASNLAVAFAETGRSALVIDCDMARPRQHEILAIPNKFGLAGLLKETERLDARSVMLAIHSTEIPGVSVMPFGNPEGLATASLMHSRRLPELIAVARESFDVVLIDTPPMLYMADSRIMGSVADGVVLVVRARQTLRESAVRAGRQLAEDGVPVLGVALNDWNPRLAGYYPGYDFRYYEQGK